MLKLTDLGDITRGTLLALAEFSEATYRDLARKTGYPGPQISSALSRLENFELVNLPEVRGGPWRITATGTALATGQPVNAPPAKAKEKARAMAKAQLTAPVAKPATTPAAKLETPAIAAQPESPAPGPAAVVPVEALEPFERVSQQILDALEIEVELDRVRVRLEAKPIPAQAQRVYNQLLAHLPPTLRQALAPVTECVELFSGL